MKFKLTQSVGVPADVAGKELERIRSQSGALTASLVLDAARPERAPLHKCFEWDDSKAAESFRLDQARNLIRSVQVIVEDKPPQTLYVHVPHEKRNQEGEYSPLHVVAKDEDKLQRAVDELRSLINGLQDTVRNVLTAAEAARRTKVARAAKAASKHITAASEALSA